MESFDEFGVIELGLWARFLIRSSVVVHAVGLGASLAILRSGAPGWRVLALLFVACALLFVRSYMTAPERWYPPIRGQAATCLIVATLCWWMSRRATAG